MKKNRPKEKPTTENNRFDKLVKLLIPILLAIFAWMFYGVKDDVKEIRVHNEAYLDKTHALEIEVEKLKLRIELIGLIPPSGKINNLNDVANLFEILKEKEKDGN